MYFKNKGVLSKISIFLIIILVNISIASSSDLVYATPKMPGYENPEDIILACPNDNYTTTSSKISILGSCDYRYPLYMNGNRVETTKYGFFNVYVDLKEGENTFTFSNHDKMKSKTIIRKKATTSISNGGSKIRYHAYNGSAYGVITANYAMPRKSVSNIDLSCKPITRGTVSKLLGEFGSYYKLENGEYVAKSSIDKHIGSLKNNQVTKAEIKEIKERNQVVTELSMNINTLYDVYFEGNQVFLTLYQTTSGVLPKVIKNSIIDDVTIKSLRDKKQIVYCFTLKDTMQVSGYDVFFNHGVLKFELKRLPIITEESKLKGVTILLDPGHGDYDPGALGPMGKEGPAEKDINLSIAQYTRDYLEQLGANVVMTREDDTFYSLSERVSKIRILRPDFSISIHGNSLGCTSDYNKTNGFLTFYSYDMGNDAPGVVNHDVTKILGLDKKSVQERSLSLTRVTTCPALLLETSFLSNPKDYEYLIQKNNQQKFGEAISKAVFSYFKGTSAPQYLDYVVKRGDSLSKIAREYGTTVEKLVQINKIDNKNCIRVGQKLKVPDHQ